MIAGNLILMQDSYIGSTSASQAEEAGSTPVSCSKKINARVGVYFFGKQPWSRTGRRSADRNQHAGGMFGIAGLDGDAALRGVLLDAEATSLVTRIFRNMA